MFDKTLEKWQKDHDAEVLRQKELEQNSKDFLAREKSQSFDKGEKVWLNEWDIRTESLSTVPVTIKRKCIRIFNQQYVVIRSDGRTRKANWWSIDKVRED